MAMPPDRRQVVADDVLLGELRAVTGDLRQSLAGTNAHTDLSVRLKDMRRVLRISTFYFPALCPRRAAQQCGAYDSSEYRSGRSPSAAFRDGAASQFRLDLHAAYVMSREDGRNLAQGADAYRRSPDQTEALKNAAERIAAAVEQTPALFAKEVREHISRVTQDIGQGTQPQRSNQVGDLDWELGGWLFETDCQASAVSLLGQS